MPLDPSQVQWDQSVGIDPSKVQWDNQDSRPEVLRGIVSKVAGPAAGFVAGRMEDLKKFGTSDYWNNVGKDLSNFPKIPTSHEDIEKNATDPRIFNIGFSALNPTPM